MRKQKRWTSVQSLLVFTAGRGRVSLDSAPGKTISPQRNLNFKTSGITCLIQYDAILYFSGHEYGEKGWAAFLIASLPFSICLPASYGQLAFSRTAALYSLLDKEFFLFLSFLSNVTKSFFPDRNPARRRQST